MSKLCSNTANCGIKKIQNALPESLKTKVVKTINISTYVFVMKNIEQAKKLLKFLEEKGFSNISIDSKGTTITAQLSSGMVNVNNFEDKLTPKGIIITYGTGCRAYKLGKACGNYYNSQKTCSNHYLFDTWNNTCIQCKWFGGTEPCRDGGCNACPVRQPIVPD